MLPRRWRAGPDPPTAEGFYDEAKFHNTGNKKTKYHQKTSALKIFFPGAANVHLDVRKPEYND